MGPKVRTVEREIARIAHRQHGVVTRAQLLRAGVTPKEIRRRIDRGALLREHRGVYRVGHRAPSVEARYLAAVYACGDGALLSGRAAAHLLDLLPGAAPPPEVTAPTERNVPGVTTRRSRAPVEATTWRGIPVTTPARTLTDLAAVLTSEVLARAAHEAEIRHHTTPAQIEAIVNARPGAPALRRVIHGDTRVTLSMLEVRFLERLKTAQLPLPATNCEAHGRRVDCRWPDHRLTVELDGYRYHHSRHAWELDRRREREARARGDEFRRYTYGDVLEAPELMLAELGELLRLEGLSQ